MTNEKYDCWKCGAETTGSVTMDDGATETVYSLCKDCIKNLKKELR